MRKFLFVILALLLLTVSASCAENSQGGEADLFDLWNYNGESRMWAGFAVPMTEGVVIASPSCIPKNTEGLAVSDGRHVWDVQLIIPDSTGTLAIICYDTENAEPRYAPWSFLPYGKTVPASSCLVRSGDALGSRINHLVLDAEPIQWEGRPCMVLSLTETVPLGSPVVTDEGELAGMIIAEYAEGANRMLALTAEGVAIGMQEASSLISSLPDWGNPPEGLRVTADRNLVSVDWTDAVLPQKAEGESIYLVVTDSGNDYLNFFPAEVRERTLSLLLTPGRIYTFGFIVSERTPDTIPEQIVLLAIPEGEPLTEFNFRSVVCTIAEAPESGLKEEEMPVPVTEVTEELLRSGRAYFYSTSTYEVTETVSGRTLLVTLTTPQGVNYRYESSWVYMPEYMKEDTWYISLGESGLTPELDRNGYPAGVYRIAFYVDGFLADAFEFELK